MKTRRISVIVSAIAAGVSSILVDAPKASATPPNLTGYTQYISLNPMALTAYQVNIGSPTSANKYSATVISSPDLNPSTYSATATVTEPLPGFYQLTVSWSPYFFVSDSLSGALDTNVSSPYKDSWCGSFNQTDYYFFGGGSTTYGPTPFSGLSF